MVEVRCGRAYPILWSAGKPVRPGLLPLRGEQPLASRPSTAKPEGTRTMGTDETAHPTLASSRPYLPSVSHAPPARHHLRQEPYAGNPPVRICAGGTAKAVSLPRHHSCRCRRQRRFWDARPDTEPWPGYPHWSDKLKTAQATRYRYSLRNSRSSSSVSAFAGRIEASRSSTSSLNAAAIFATWMPKVPRNSPSALPNVQL